MSRSGRLAAAQVSRYERLEGHPFAAGRQSAAVGVYDLRRGALLRELPVRPLLLSFVSEERLLVVEPGSVSLWKV